MKVACFLSFPHENDALFLEDFWIFSNIVFPFECSAVVVVVVKWRIRLDERPSSLTYCR